MYMKHYVILIIQILIVIVPLLISVAYFTLAERKTLASIQRRQGPNIVGFYGSLQPLADGLKLFLKETIVPYKSNSLIFILAPILTFTISLITWSVIPIGKFSVIADINIGILYLLAVSSLGVYGIIMSGWASNSKYAFLGSLRSAAQMISYEVSIGLILVSVLIFVGSFNLSDIVNAQQEVWYAIPLFPLFIMFLISMLAETNRPPFDLPEAEAELVSGYNVEYSSMGFALFFLGETANILLMSSLCSILFLGGWLSPFSVLNFIPGVLWIALKISLLSFFFIWVRATYPRLRYDQLMSLGWKVLLPLSMGIVLLMAGVSLSNII